MDELYSTFLKVKAMFDASPQFDRFRSYFEPDRRAREGNLIPSQILAVFAPSSFTHRNEPQWTEPRTPQWIRDDRRWVELCVSLRHDPSLGSIARNVLRYVDPDHLETALAAAPPREKLEVTTRPVGDLLSRYRAGEHAEVWQTLRSFSAMGGELRREAEAVALETMQRVRHNLDLLAGRLEEHGWTALTGQLRTPPDPGDVDLFAEIESLTKSPLPPSLLAFWKVVGGVDLVWDYNQRASPPNLAAVDLAALDPLSVDPPASAEGCLEEWRDHMESTHPELLDPFPLDLAPDSLHKVNVSGGGPYGVDLPFLGADPIWRGEEPPLPFVEYLRLCLRWGGFPRLEQHAAVAGVSELVAKLTDGFMPF